jgi:hypothetical protein
MSTPLAVLIAVACGVFGGGLGVDAQRLDQAIRYGHASSIVPFLPLFLLARSWKWLFCGIPGVLAGAIMIAFRDDLANRRIELSRGPAFAMAVAWLLGWLPTRIVNAWKGRSAYATYMANPIGDIESRRPNSYFPAGMVCLLIPVAWTLVAIVQVESRNLIRTDTGREILAMTQFVTVICVLGGILLASIGWARHWRFRSRVGSWLSATTILLFVVLPIQLVLLWILSVSVNGLLH